MQYSRPWMYAGLTLMAVGVFLLLKQGHEPVAMAEPPKDLSQNSSVGQPPSAVVSDSAQPRAAVPHFGTDSQKAAGTEKNAWKDLFDGKTLAGWEVPEFGGEGKVEVKDGRIVLGLGSSMTGITRLGEVIRDNYELTLEGMRLDGSDFFCTTTFPVGKGYCSLVVGGWGGGLVGLSSIDGADASENSTTKIMTFKDNQWYAVRIRVSDAAIEAWIDGKQVVDQPREGHKFTTRIECTQCRPLGISTWGTAGAIRSIRVRPLRTEEIREIQVEHPSER
jgi:hypothetical protein